MNEPAMCGLFLFAGPISAISYKKVCMICNRYQYDEIRLHMTAPTVGKMERF